MGWRSTSWVHGAVPKRVDFCCRRRQNTQQILANREDSMTTTADIGLIGLAVMGQNLVLNMNDHGFTVAVFNRTTSKVDAFLADEARGTQIVGTHSLDELVGALKRPRES